MDIYIYTIIELHSQLYKIRISSPFNQELGNYTNNLEN